MVDIETRMVKWKLFFVGGKNRPHPAILMLMDAPGIRNELYDMARRLATVGFVILPNLYYRAGMIQISKDVLEKQCGT